MNGRLQLVVFVMACSTAIALAQNAPKVEVFGGYSYANVDPGDLCNPGQICFGPGNPRASLHGWNAAVAGNLSPWLGAVADLSGFYGSPTLNFLIGGPFGPRTSSTNVNMRDYTFLFGPHFAYRRKKATTFAHALFGAAHSGVRQGNDGGTGSAADTSFAMAIGGGFDVNLTRSFAWRVQTDYLQTRFSSEMQNNLRVSTGIVLRIGK